MSEDWDVEAYKNEFEYEEHWELRKNFMLAHKDKFTEEETVCLAQVFANIELMGCRYPDQTMIRVAELAKGLVEKFREKKKNSLKRTFVAASDAASSKIKRQSSKKETEGVPNKIQKMECAESKNHSQNVKDVEIITIADDNVKNNGVDVSKPKVNNSQKGGRLPKYGGVKTFNINSIKDPVQSTSEEKKLTGPFGELVLFYYNEDESSLGKIVRSASVNKINLRWVFEATEDSLRAGKLFLNDQLIATGIGENIKASKEIAADIALNKLKESYFSVRVKSRFFAETTVDSSIFKTDSVPGKKLDEDSVGGKLMKLMGWRGGGLGSKEQGIEEPICAPLHVRRDGFGQTKNNGNIADFTKKARIYIKTWMESNSEQDLVFSSDFSCLERKVMHEIAGQFLLKSKSFGKHDNRKLVISRKVSPWEIVEEMRKNGGISEKYELIPPTKANS